MLSRSTKTRATATPTKMAFFSEIDFNYEDTSRTLTISKRRGEFPGMLRRRSFRIVVVAPCRGAGGGFTPEPDAIVGYDGCPVVVALG